MKQIEYSTTNNLLHIHKNKYDHANFFMKVFIVAFCIIIYELTNYKTILPIEYNIVS